MPERRSDYLQQSKQDKLSVCISAWSGPITLFYPPGVICRFIGRTLDTLFRRYLWSRHGAARRSKVAECTGACIGSIEKSVTAYPAEASFVATRRVKSIYCGSACDLPCRKQSVKPHCYYPQRHHDCTYTTIVSAEVYSFPHEYTSS